MKSVRGKLEGLDDVGGVGVGVGRASQSRRRHRRLLASLLSISSSRASSPALDAPPICA